MPTRATPQVLVIGALLSLLGCDADGRVLGAVSTSESVRAQARPDACADRPRLREGARVALAALRAEDASALRGCGGAPLCGQAHATVDRTRCVIELVPESWGYRVRVVPRAASGAPAELRLNVDIAAGTTHQVVASGSRWAVGNDVAVVGVTEHRRHTHGGEPARIYSARFHAWNDGRAPVPLTLEGGAFVHNGRERPLVGATLEPASLPPGESEFEVRFERHEAYQSWNDHFSVVARLRAGSVALAPSAEWLVMRVSPLRH